MLNSKQKKEAKAWKDASIKKGILASKTMSLKQSYSDFVNCGELDPTYVKNTLALLG